jgi:carboxyl-terminal processing protease
MSLLVFCFNASQSNDTEKDILRLVKKTLLYTSYSPKSFDDSYSKDVFKKYMGELDPFKRYFLQSDIDEFEQSELKMSKFFDNDDPSFYHLTIDHLYQRIDETQKYIDEIFKEPLDLNKEDYFIIDEKKRTYAKNEREAKEEWRRYIKYSILREIFNTKNGDSLSSDDDDPHSNIQKIKDNPAVSTEKVADSLKNKTPKTDAEIKEDAVQKVKENLSEYFRRLKSRKKSDWFTVFVNSYTEVFDPHTQYFSPKEKEDFNTSMSGRLFGIGAQLSDKKGYATIVELIIGGPAWKSKKLDVGDKILKVQQEIDGKPVNIVDMPLDDAIRLIRGEEGTTVVLTIQKKDGSVKIISIVRAEIEIQDVFVRSAILTDENGDKYGMLYLPEFYIDMENNKGRDCSNDVKKEIEELKKQNIKGLIMDIRNNGGGSLSEVVDITGLFVGRGAVVQVKDSKGKITVLESKENEIAWDGPLVVMVNELSASASEILAGAMQDYHRAVIVGSPQTFGKGTVQTVYPLDKFNLSDNKYGALKVTVQKFYRITGSSTQLKGVNSDISIPDMFTYSDIYEKSQDYALPWDQITGTTYTPWAGIPVINYDYLKKQSAERLKGNSYITSIEEAGKWLKEQEKEYRISLKYDTFMNAMKRKREQSKKYEKETTFDAKISVDAPVYETAKFKIDTVLKAKREVWHKSMKKDFNLRESINVLNDMQGNKK